MDIFKRINRNNLKQDKRKSLTLIIAIAISTCLFTMVATFMIGLIDAAEEETIRERGNYYLRMNDKNNEYYNEFINDRDVEHIARLYRIRKCYLKTSGECSQDVWIMGCDKKALSQLNIVIKKGKMPANPKEIILPIEFEEELFEIGDIGKYIDLTDKEIFYQQDNISDDNSSETKYKIVGYYKGNIVANDSESNYVFSGYDSSSNKEDSVIFIKLKDGILGTKTNKFIKKYDLKKFEYKTNDEVLLYKGMSKYKDLIITYMIIFSLFYIVSFIASIVIISNAIMISYNNRRRQMGLLASIGATKKQLNKMILYEVRESALLGVPLGILIGTIVTYFFSQNFFNLIFEKMSDIHNYSGKLSVDAIIIILLFEIISILIATIKPRFKIKRMNVIESAKEKEEINENKVKKRGSWLSKRFGIEGMVADKYFKVNNKKYKRTMRGLAFSMVLFTVSISLCNLLEKGLDESVKMYDADMTINTDYMDMSDSDSAYKRSIRRYNKAKDSIKTVDGIKSKYFYCEDGDVEEVGIINKEDLSENELETIKERENVKSELPDKIGYHIINIYVDENMYRNIIKQNNLDESKYINNPNPKGILYNVRQIENSDKTSPILTRKISNIVAEDHMSIMDREGEIGENYNANYNIWPILVYNDLEDHMVNDMMITYMSEDKNEKDIIEPLITKNIEFDDIIDKKIDGFKNDDYNKIYFIYPDNIVKKVNEYTVVIKTDNYREMKSGIESWMKENNIDESNMMDKVEIKEVFGVLVLCIKVFAYIFVILMFIMAIANVLNIISTNFYYRRRDYAMIQSVGMSDKGLRKMLIYECLNYGIRAFMTGLPISIILSVLIKLGTGELKSYFAGSNVFMNILTYIKNILPWGAVGISVIVIFAVVFLSMIYSIHKIKKESIIDTIKSTDI